MLQKCIFLLGFIVILSSCSQGFQTFHAEPELIDYESDEQMHSLHEVDSCDVSCAFVGDALNYVIFQIDIEHELDESQKISASDLRIVDLTTAQIIHSISREEALASLESEQEDLQREKKDRTINNVFWVGVSLLVALLGVGGSEAAADSFAYSIESSVNILQERRDFDIINGSIEEEIKYIEDWTLGEDIVNPHESYTVDVLFPRDLDLQSIEVQVDFAGNKLYFPFKVSLQKIK